MQDAPTAEDDASFGVSSEPTARILNVTAAEYHADPCEVPSLSASCAKVIVGDSPAHAWLYHPRLGGKDRKDTAAMNEGTLYHRLILEAGAPIVEIAAADFKTKVAREARDEAIGRGAIPVLAADLEAAREQVAAWRGHFDRLGLRFDGKSEVAVAWNEQTGNGDPVACRAMMDHVIASRATILDLKFVASAHPRDCVRNMIEYGYDIQHAAYISAAQKLWPASRPRMTFVFCEKTAPYCVTPIDPAGTMRELGLSKWRRAVETWAKCRRDDYWPGYVTETIRGEAPEWAIYQEMGTQ